MKGLISLFIILGVLGFYSCASTAVQEEPQEPAVQEVSEVQEQPQKEEPAEEVKPEEQEDSTQYKVSQEVYDKTFEEIEQLIKELNTVISKKQYNKWLSYLSQSYIKTYSSKEVLDKINEYPQLKDNKIVLKTLHDYFDWVVVPSRSKAVLDDIVFIDENKVIAYSSYDGKRAKLYELEKINGKWRITEWE